MSGNRGVRSQETWGTTVPCSACPAANWPGCSPKAPTTKAPTTKAPTTIGTKAPTTKALPTGCAAPVLNRQASTASGHHAITTLAPTLSTKAKLGQTQGGRKYVVIMIHTWNVPLMSMALKSWLESGWAASDIVIIDNAHHPKHMLPAQVKREHMVIRTSSSLGFAHLQNMMGVVAKKLGADVYFWGHEDTVLLSYQHKSFKRLALEAVEDLAPFGVLFYAYDWFAVSRADSPTVPRLNVAEKRAVVRHCDCVTPSV